MSPAEEERARMIGNTMARKVFDGKKRRGAPRAEIHVREAELAMWLAAAYHLGREDAEKAMMPGSDPA